MLALYCCNSPKEEALFDIREFIAKSPDEVATLMGKPDTTYHRTIFGKRYAIQYYHQYGIEIRSLNNRVAEVIVNEPYPLKFTPETITEFGLDFVEPTRYEPESMISWTNLEGIKAATFYIVGIKKPDSIEHNYKIYFNLSDTTQAAVK